MINHKWKTISVFQKGFVCLHDELLIHKKEGNMKIRSFWIGIICIALLLNAMAAQGQTQTGEQLNAKIKRVAAKITQMKSQGGDANAIKNQIKIE